MSYLAHNKCLLINGRTHQYHYPLDIGFQIQTVVSSTFQTSDVLPVEMFFDGTDGKHGKVTANIQGLAQHLMKRILNNDTYDLLQVEQEFRRR